MATDDTVPFEPDAVREFLDGAIRQWRTTRDRAREAGDDMDLPEHYIDAFQSMRTSLFGEALPIDSPAAPPLVVYAQLWRQRDTDTKPELVKMYDTVLGPVSQTLGEFFYIEQAEGSVGGVRTRWTVKFSYSTR